MLEGVLKDLQGVIKKEKDEYSFEQSRNPKQNHHFTSLRQIMSSTPTRPDRRSYDDHNMNTITSLKTK